MGSTCLWCPPLLPCLVLSGPLVTVCRSGLALYIDVLFIPYSLAGADGQAGFGCRLFSSRSSALPLAAVSTVQATESPPNPLSENKAIQPPSGAAQREPSSAVPAPYFAASPGPGRPWKAGGLGKLGHTCPWFGNSYSDLRSLAVPSFLQRGCFEVRDPFP